MNVLRPYTFQLVCYMPISCLIYVRQCWFVLAIFFEFHICGCTSNLNQNQFQNSTLSLRNSQDCTFHLVFLFSPPTLFWLLSVLHICWECQMTGWYPAVVAGGAKGFGARGTGHSAEHFVVGGARDEDTGNFWGWGWCMFWVSILDGFCKFPSQSSSLCSSSLLQMGQCSPHVQFLTACLGGNHHLRDSCYLRWCFRLHGRDRCWGWGRRDWQVLSGLKQVLWSRPCIGPRSTLSDWGLRYVLQRRGVLDSGSNCGVGNFWKLTCCKFMHCHWYGCCSEPCSLCLGSCSCSHQSCSSGHGLI